MIKMRQIIDSFACVENNYIWYYHVLQCYIGVMKTVQELEKVDMIAERVAKLVPRRSDVCKLRHGIASEKCMHIEFRVRNNHTVQYVTQVNYVVEYQFGRVEIFFPTWFLCLLCICFTWLYKNSMYVEAESDSGSFENLRRIAHEVGDDVTS